MSNINKEKNEKVRCYRTFFITKEKNPKEYGEFFKRLKFYLEKGFISKDIKLDLDNIVYEKYN